MTARRCSTTLTARRSWSGARTTFRVRVGLRRANDSAQPIPAPVHAMRAPVAPSALTTLAARLRRRVPVRLDAWQARTAASAAHAIAPGTARSFYWGDTSNPCSAVAKTHRGTTRFPAHAKDGLLPALGAAAVGQSGLGKNNNLS